MLLLQELPPAAQAISFSLTQIIVYGGIALLGGGGGATILIKLLNRGSDKADVASKKLKNAEDALSLNLAEADAAELLKAKVEALVTESIAKMEAMQRLQTEKAAAELLVKVKDGQLGDLGDRLGEVLIQVGRFQAGEETCRRELAAVRKELLTSKDAILSMQQRIDQLADHETILGQNIQMKAILRTLRLDGVWSGNEESL